MPLHKECCARTFLRGIARFGLSDETSAGVVRISTERASAARAVISAAHLAGIDATITRRQARGSNSRFTVRLALGDRSPGIPAGRLGTNDIPARICCRKTLLRAAFLACGSVSDPSRSTHLEFYCHSDPAARTMCDLTGCFGVDAGMARRRGRPLVYLKHADAVSVLLGQMGATHAVLRLADQRAMNQTKNSIRRTVNSETANAARAATSAARQRDAALRALATIRAPKMSPALREAARLRIAFPTRTLRELARAARPPISKAAMASRLRLLERMAER